MNKKSHSFIEKRKHPRVPCSLSVTVGEGGGEFKTCTANISESGMMFLCDTLFSSMTKYGIAFSLSGESDTIICEATVVWSNKIKNANLYAVGMLFSEIQEEDRLKIRAFVEKRLKPETPRLKKAPAFIPSGA